VTRLKRLACSLSLAALAAAGAGSAFAADIAPLVAPVPVFNWSGGYVGLSGGYGWGDSTASTGSAFSTSNNGGTLGGQIGANFLFNNNFLLGVEGDLNWTGISGSVSPGPTVSQDIDWFGSLRGRIGMPMGNFLPYLTGGMAIAGETRSTTAGGGNSEDRTHAGFVLGGGLEWAWSRNITSRIEYQYLNFGSATYSAIPADPSVKQTLSTVRFGVNFKY
jgi:opacity protein-like surface antigen